MHGKILECGLLLHGAACTYSSQSNTQRKTNHKTKHILNRISLQGAMPPCSGLCTEIYTKGQITKVKVVLKRRPSCLPGAMLPCSSLCTEKHTKG